ncbi:MAG: tRNA (5-methylaminomethyl-2-thiouridine)(34)-methyltransferase MnmD [Paracoccus sp. (in: a-proteobacteria)]|uniref:FAD-dependent oxidoreductase n=1 Tax=Marinibacterium profundimaris TaxID=1679460 RepID=A0A225NWE4_9RHOB|nr:tRNA (5-methylaminomethyl-2-thiouridine)(34)-methyltransferase MnmD [Marinibacterium profundimaris]OWU76046.1 FAD-dependent oxidoreductase [Marinibacterium profundimaris]
MQHQQAQVSWRDDRVPVSDRFDDPYYSIQDGVEETRHTFLGGNGLPARFGGAFRVAELGFGTGLNFLVTLQAWVAAGSPGTLHYTSFEAFPMAAADMARALEAFADLPGRDLLAEAWADGRFPAAIGGATLDLRLGDARTALPEWEGQADAWFLDGFAPARNPELWEPALMAEVARHTAPGGTLATYTAAGHVRRTLDAAGFDITRQPGYGRKRHMTTGVLR